MNAGRALAMLFVVSLALSALSGTLSPAAAQGAGADTPSGYALAPTTGETETGSLPAFVGGLRFMSLRNAPFMPMLATWMPSKRCPLATDRVSLAPIERRAGSGPAIRQRATPAGR